MFPRVSMNIGDKHLQMAEGFESCKTIEGTRHIDCFHILVRTLVVLIAVFRKKVPFCSLDCFIA